MNDERTASLELPLGVDAPTAARRALAATLISWGFTDQHWLENAALVVSELVTNALRHGGGCVELTLSAHHGQVTVSASDGSAVVPRRRDPIDGGRGLEIIEALSQQWGVQNLEGGGKRVFVILAPYPAPDPATQQR